jgi:hypothetical protein
MVFDNIYYISQWDVQTRGSSTIRINILKWLSVSFQAPPARTLENPGGAHASNRKTGFNFQHGNKLIIML